VEDAFDLFVRRVEELHRTRLVRTGGLRASFNLSAAKNRAVDFSTHSPDEDDLRSFLLTFRQFTLKGEPIEAGRIANQLWQELIGDETRSLLASARERYRAALRTGSLGYVLNGHRFTPEEVLDLWINGRYFHNDTRKAAAIDALDPVSSIFVRHVFLDVLIEATKYFTFLADVIVISRRAGVL